ncbi:hypothetical protein KAW64_11910 [bacterium]|nr:hypothetical protein [bacterium]
MTPRTETQDRVAARSLVDEPCEVVVGPLVIEGGYSSNLQIYLNGMSAPADIPTARSMGRVLMFWANFAETKLTDIATGRRQAAADFERLSPRERGEYMVLKVSDEGGGSLVWRRAYAAEGARLLADCGATESAELLRDIGRAE